MGRLGVIGGPTDGNLTLVAGLVDLGVEAVLLSPLEAGGTLEPGDTALVRLDVLKTLDGVEPGLELVPELAGNGVRILNPVEALLNAHDKLRTAARLAEAGLPHPTTAHLTDLADVLGLEPPIVLKPRFGSWGKDVWRCRNLGDLRGRAGDLRTRAWFRRHGVLAQDLHPSPGYDLRLVVAGGELVGAARRVAAPREWRTNTSTGGHMEAGVASAEAAELGVRAAAALGSDLVGVDLLPGTGGFTVLELNGAVEFSPVYSLPNRAVCADVAAALELLPVAAR